MIPVPEAPRLTGTPEAQLAQMRRYCISLSEWLSIFLDEASSKPAVQRNSEEQSTILPAFPEGSVITIVSGENPGTILGGTWTAEGSTQLDASGLTAFIWRRTS